MAAWCVGYYTGERNKLASFFLTIHVTIGGVAFVGPRRTPEKRGEEAPILIEGLGKYAPLIA